MADSVDGFDDFVNSGFHHREPSPRQLPDHLPTDKLPEQATLTPTPDSPLSSFEKVCFNEDMMESKSDEEEEEEEEEEDTLLGKNQFPSVSPAVGVNQLMKVEDHNGLQIKHEITHTEIADSDESGTEEDRSGFMHILETFCKENALEFKPPKFYGEPLNCLKLWRAVTRLGGYERVTASKLWRQVGESFNPPKTCTTVSWTFRIFYEKALLEYEKHKRQTGELQFPEPSFPDPIAVESETTGTGYKTPGSGRARRDSAARAMQGWHSHRVYDHGEGKNPNSTVKREKHLKSIGVNPGLSRQKKAANMEHADKAAHIDADAQLRSLEHHPY